MVGVLLGHNWRLFREALDRVLDQERDLRVLADVADAEELLTRARQLRPDVVVFDIRLGDPNGAQALCAALRDAVPDAGVLVILDRRSHAGAARALARLAPGVGVLTTEASPADLIDAIRRLARRETVLDARLAVAALVAEHGPLTEREREVLRLTLAGRPTKEIAGMLHLSAGTVRNCLSRIQAKTGARTRIEALRMAEESGWI